MRYLILFLFLPFFTKAQDYLSKKETFNYLSKLGSEFTCRDTLLRIKFTTTIVGFEEKFKAMYCESGTCIELFLIEDQFEFYQKYLKIGETIQVDGRLLFKQSMNCSVFSFVLIK